MNDDLTWLEMRMNEPESYVVMDHGKSVAWRTRGTGLEVLDMDVLDSDPESDDSAIVERLYARLRALQAEGEPVYQQVRETKAWLDAHYLALAPEAMEELNGGEDG